MGLFEHFPYTNFHDLNLNWIIGKIKNVETAEANTAASAEAAAASAEASQLSANASAESAAASQLSAEASAESAESIADLSGQIRTNTARIDNIIADGQQTEGNTELIDIRVGYNGITYPTAGAAVRGEDQGLADAIKMHANYAEDAYYVTSVNLFNYNDVELGSLNSSGQEIASDTIYRSKFIPLDPTATKVTHNYSLRGHYYDAALNYIDRDSAGSAGTYDIPGGAVYIRFVVQKTVYDAHTDLMYNTGESLLPFQPFALYVKYNTQGISDAIENGAGRSAMDSERYYTELYKVIKRAAVCGDSLSVGYSRNPDTQESRPRNLDYSWVKCVGRDSAAYWLNMGTSGQNVLTWCTNDRYGKVQLEGQNNKSQVYIIGLGENDINDVPLGTSDDITNDPDIVATTYYGGYSRIIELIKRVNPDAKIICVTNARTAGLRAQYNEAVRYIAQTHYTTDDNVFLLDMAADYGYLFTTAGYPLTIDKAAVSHYSSLGYQIISKIMEYAISKLMLDNYLDFIDMLWIPYDTGEPTGETM